MKRIFLVFILWLPSFYVGHAEELPGKFYISKVNRVEKQWVVSPDKRNFIGSRGIQKFDYGRPILKSEDRGENYIVTWSYHGKKLSSPLILKFEYRLALDQKEPGVEEFSYPNLKPGTYSWTFKNLGERYIGKGKVNRWKASLVLDGKVVAEKRSFTWHAMEGA